MDLLSPTMSVNRLSESLSPYLLQHADNPVDWYEWGEEAFQLARELDRPVFLSIGYSTCHWCHVMAHESFEDDYVAGLMNETFVNIKVDREERPDIDQIYMTVCQIVTGHGGWPLTVILTPEKKPLFAGTYIPRESRYGRSGMLDLVPGIKKAWVEKREQLLESAEQLTQALMKTAPDAPPERGIDTDYLLIAFKQLEQQFDAEFGGFGTAPKFPTPHQLLFLMRFWKRHSVPEALPIVEKTLRHMRLGGLFDHIGFGFHRYATDREWLLPHFEKMLYDQAMLALAYTEAYQVTKDPAYREVVEEIFNYVLRDMTHPEGGFYSAEDADSDGVEGKFYVWTVAEIKEVLDSEEAGYFLKRYNMSDEGNFEDEATRQKTGENIPHLLRPLQPEETEQWERIRKKLFAHRKKRIHPEKDDKILADWNGLMIAAFAQAGVVMKEPRYIEAARKAIGFFAEYLLTDAGTLVHRFRAGRAGLQANLDDYAFMIWGLIEFYQATFEPVYLDQAIQLMEKQSELFWDPEAQVFNFTPEDGEALLIRAKEGYDGAIPSGNSISMLNMIRLARLTGRTEWEEQSEDIIHFFSEVVRRSPMGFTAMLTAFEMATGDGMEILLVGENKKELEAMLSVIQDVYLPDSIVHVIDQDNAEYIARLATYTSPHIASQKGTTAYVCRQFACKQPVHTAAELAALLGT